jgi:hypothetical protein
MPECNMALQQSGKREAPVLPILLAKGAWSGNINISVVREKKKEAGRVIE